MNNEIPIVIDPWVQGYERIVHMMTPYSTKHDNIKDIDWLKRNIFSFKPRVPDEIYKEAVSIVKNL